MEKLNESVSSSDELFQYLVDKGKKHRYYKFYTNNGELINAILSTHSIYFSNGDRWNDTKDRTNFNPADDDRKRYGLCMSYMKSENVAMWMLYGKNDGYMIDFGKEIMEDCLETEEIELGKIRKNGFEKIRTLDRSDFDIDIMDVVYFGDPKDHSTDSFYIKRADEVVQNCPRRIIQDIPYCKKTIPWLYECECRLVVSVGKDIEDIDRCDTVKIAFKEKKIDKLKGRIFHSPNHKGTYNYEKSRLTGDIEWDV